MIKNVEKMKNQQVQEMAMPGSCLGVFPLKSKLLMSTVHFLGATRTKTPLKKFFDKSAPLPHWGNFFLRVSEGPWVFRSRFGSWNKPAMSSTHHELSFELLHVAWHSNLQIFKFSLMSQTGLSWSSPVTQQLAFYSRHLQKPDHDLCIQRDPDKFTTQRGHAARGID